MINSLLLFIFVSVAMPILGVAAKNDLGLSGSTVIAEINGNKLTLEEFEKKRASALFQARNNYYKVERQALDQFIDEQLLEEQARRENVTVQQLWERHVLSTLPKDPSEETLRVYYEGVDTTEPYEAVRSKILEALRQRRLEKARAAYVKSLRTQATVVISFSAPQAEIPLKDASIRGRQNAPVIITEYADYECPYCQQFHPELKKLEAEYKDKLAFVFKDYPLPMHAHAQKAAEAAQCASVQGKYWEYHDLLFETKKFDIPELKQDARNLKLDAAAFDKCLDSGERAEAVKRDLTEAQKFGLQVTPSVFINGHAFDGALKYETLREAVEQELAASSTTQPKQTAKK